MGVIRVNNENICILNDNDIIYHIEQNCGYELAEMLKDRLIIDDYETKLAREKSMTDEESYCAQVESMGCCLRDILDEVEKLLTGAVRLTLAEVAAAFEFSETSIRSPVNSFIVGSMSLASRMAMPSVMPPITVNESLNCSAAAAPSPTCCAWASQCRRWIFSIR